MLQKEQSPMQNAFFSFLVFSLTVLLINSCKKTDSLISSNTSKNEITQEKTAENFFRLPANAAPVLQRIAKELERQNKTHEFIKAFITKEGFPIWNKSRIEKYKRKVSTANADGDGEVVDTIVYIPLVVSMEQYVHGFLKATVGDTIDIKIYRQNDYLSFPFQGSTFSTNVTTAENFALHMMLMDNEVFGSTEFKIEDKRLFHDGTDYSDTANTQRFIKFNVLTGNQSFGSGGTTINNLQREVCVTVSYMYIGSCVIRCWNIINFELCFWVDEPPGGGGSGGQSGGWPYPPPGGGGPGGGGTNNSCWPGGENIVNGFVPIECDPGPGGNPWPPSTAQEFLDLQWMTDHVKDSTIDPCITNALATLKNISAKFPAVIRGFFSAAPSFEMVFKKYVDPVWNTAGTPIPPEGAFSKQTINSNVFNVNINRYYSDCTDLGLAATIIHEALHCHLKNLFNLAYTSPDSTAIRVSLTNQYGYLFPPPGIGGNTDSLLTSIINGMNPFQHQDMIARYQTQVATALQQFALAKGITIDSSYCKDLSWTGCFDSKAFASLSQTDKTRIKNRVFAEKDPYSSLTYTDANNYTFIVNENSYPRKGHPCH